MRERVCERGDAGEGMREKRCGRGDAGEEMRERRCGRGDAGEVIREVGADQRRRQEVGTNLKSRWGARF